MKKGSPAEYFDGVSPAPHRGRLFLDGHSLEFSPDARNSPICTFQIRDIIRTDQHSEGTYIRIRLHHGLTGSLLTTDAQLLEELRYRRRSGMTGGARLVDVIHNWSWRRTLVWLAITLPVFIAIVYLLASQFYRLLPVSVDQKFGERVYADMQEDFGPECSDKKALAELKKISAGLSEPDSPFTPDFIILQNTMPNAFALPGGRVIVMTGIYDRMDSREQMAAVLAHELAHVEKRHSMQQLSRILALRLVMAIVLQGFTEGFDMYELAGEFAALYYLLDHSRNNEMESDREAVQKMLRAGYDPLAMVTFFRNMERKTLGSFDVQIPENWSTHPDTPKRIKEITRLTREGRRKFPAGKSPAYIRGRLHRPVCG